MNFDQEQGIELAQFAVDQALQAGADEAAAHLEIFHHLYFRFAKNHMIQNMEKNPVTLTLAVSIGKKECALSMSGYDRDSIRTLARKCVENSKLFFDNEEHLPPVSGSRYRHVNALDPAIIDLNPREIAAKVKTICTASQQKNLEAFGTLRKFHGLRCIANSSDTRTAYEWTKMGCSVTAKTPDGTGSGREEQEVYFVKQLQCQEILEKAMATASRSHHPVSLEPGDYTVILAPAAAAAYLTFILFALDSRMVEEGRSVFSARNNGSGPAHLDERCLFSKELRLSSLVDDSDYPVSPFNPTFSFDGRSGQGMCSNLFSNGLPTRNTTFIENGSIQDLFYSYYWATQKKRKPIGHPGLMLFEAADGPVSVQKMIENTARGLYVSSFWYIRFVDPNNLLLTGLTRDGTFLIENGSLTQPIKNLRFNESPFLSLGKIKAIGEPELRRLWFQQVLMPAVKIDDFTFSSISDAI
ncbi:metallopeptidase TldD-related protein [candidate division CSSED10-310 bacterium]|uniref:Metallopeptidase TldD-related protein n=1 Tax=candidate division CSSED10-310 bacterium TaxID=2855610 RepID=A0ABV6Z6T4_UNCC1